MSFATISKYTYNTSKYAQFVCNNLRFIEDTTKTIISRRIVKKSKMIDMMKDKLNKMQKALEKINNNNIFIGSYMKKVQNTKANRNVTNKRRQLKQNKNITSKIQIIAKVAKKPYKSIASAIPNAGVDGVVKYKLGRPRKNVSASANISANIIDKIDINDIDGILDFLYSHHSNY